MVVESGHLFVGDNSVICLNQTNLVTNGEISASDSSLTVISGSNYILKIEGSSPARFGNLKIDSDISLETPLEVQGNITLKSGILDLKNSDINLDGNLIGENETNKVFSTGTGKIFTTIDLVNGQPINPGNLGLTITPSANYSQIKFARGHDVQFYNSSASIYRNYSLPEINESAGYEFKYLTSELGGLDEENLNFSGNENGEWKLIENSLSNSSENKVSAQFDKSFTQITLFEWYGEKTVKIPNGFSPNNDGDNDLFQIPEIGSFPNNKLTIFNQWGEVLYEAEPYENNWGGENNSGKSYAGNKLLSDGTYFYLFLKDKNDKKSVMKGFVEIKKGDK
jgi:gliding motility-associated-like protein